MLTGQEDEQPRLSFGQYLSKGSVLPTLKVGRADLDAGIIHEGDLARDGVGRSVGNWQS